MSKKYSEILAAKKNLYHAAEVIDSLYDDRVRLGENLYNIKIEYENQYEELRRLKAVLERIANSGIENNQAWAWIQGIAAEAIRDN